MIPGLVVRSLRKDGTIRHNGRVWTVTVAGCEHDCQGLRWIAIHDNASGFSGSPARVFCPYHTYSGAQPIGRAEVSS